MFIRRGPCPTDKVPRFFFVINLFYRGDPILKGVCVCVCGGGGFHISISEKTLALESIFIFQVGGVWTPGFPLWIRTSFLW